MIKGNELKQDSPLPVPEDGKAATKALTGKKLSIAQDLYSDKHHPIAEILQTLKISRATLYRALKSGERVE